MKSLKIWNQEKKKCTEKVGIQYTGWNEVSEFMWQYSWKEFQKIAVWNTQWQGRLQSMGELTKVTGRIAHHEFKEQ